MRWRYGELMKVLVAIAAGIFIKTFFDLGMQKFDCGKCQDRCKKELEEVDIIRPDLQQQLREQFKPQMLYDVLHYDYFTGKHMFSLAADQPKMLLRGHQKSDIRDIVRQAMSLFSITKHSESMPNKWELKSVQNGFRRYDPLRGEEYVLDITMQTRTERPSLATFRMELVKPYGPAQLVTLFPVKQRPVIHFLLPLSYTVNSSQLSQFIRDFENSCLKTKEGVTVYVLLYSGPNMQSEERAAEIKNRLLDSKLKYPGSRIQVILTKKNPSRAFLLDLGMKQLGNDVLTSFINVHVSFSQDFLDRCRFNPIVGKRIFYPVGFTRYSQEIVAKYSPDVSDVSDMNSQLGYWAQDKYDVVCMYSQDYRNVQGFDLSSKRAGDDLKDLYKKHIKRGYQIFRAIDPGLSWKYSDSHCDNSLQPAEFSRCVAELAKHLGSKEQLAKKILLKKTS